MKRVLIVDNSRLMRSILKELLSELDLEPIGEATNVQEGLKAYRALRPDLITLDIIMPDGSGLEVLKKIRSTDPKTQVLVVTESGQRGVEEQLLALGVNAILYKPITRQGLQQALEKIESESNRARTKPGKLRALVIDDSLVMRQMIKELLAEVGVETAGEAADAVEISKAYRNCKPDFVTLDLIMPGGSGIDVLRRILAKDPKAKIVVVSSLAQDKVTQQALRLGACAVLHKPLTQEAIKGVLNQIFPPHRQRPVEAKAKQAPQDDSRLLPPDQIKTLEQIFRTGGQSCLQAMDTLCKTRWKLTGIQFLNGKHAPAVAHTPPSYLHKATTVQITVAHDIPIVCLLFISQLGIERIAEILTQNQHGTPNQDVIRHVLMEWANILITAILNAFANSMGGALMNTPPSILEGTLEEILPRSIKELSDIPERSVLARVRYACEGLKAECEIAFILRTDSIPKLSTVGV